jgi:hypothetical protein
MISVCVETLNPWNARASLMANLVANRIKRRALNCNALPDGTSSFPFDMIRLLSTENDDIWRAQEITIPDVRRILQW